MYKISISLLVITSLLSSGCSSTRKSLTLGLGTGAVTGAAIGAMSSKNHSQGALTGLALGAVVGGIASYFIHGGLEERDKETRKETLFNLEKHGVFGEPEPKSEESPWTYREWPREHFGGRDH
jgi:hypothetical protein